MGLNKKSVDDINVKGLKVLCRCDFNVQLKAEAPSFFEPTSTLTGTQHRRPDVRPSLCSGRQKVC